MPSDEVNFTTGPSLVPDIGTLKYNGCIFSPLFETKVTGNCIKDAANRTVKYMEYTIVVDGYVTLPEGDTTIAPTMATLYNLLTAQGGALVYTGKALDLVVNAQGGGGIGPNAHIGLGPIVGANPNDDVAWGPVPELLEFQPLGSGNSAKIQWKVTVRLPSLAVSSTSNSLGLLQLNYETSVTYNEDGFSTISISGVMEIPMTRRPSQTTRTVFSTVDQFRNLLEKRILQGIDLGKFRVTRRDFHVSRDKRTLEWDFQAEERPYMDIPPECTIARGSFGVRPAKTGEGLVKWLCTLRATYTVRADRKRRSAWWAFLALLRLRMRQAETTPIPDDDPPKPPGIPFFFGPIVAGAVVTAQAIARKQLDEERVKKGQRRAWLIDFSFDEGLYLDSKTISFSATWRATVSFANILLGSGLWKKVLEGARTPKESLWAISMKDIMGAKSWLPNEIDPSLDIIVDFGSTGI